MSSIVELARLPNIRSVSIASASAEETVELPGGLMGFVIYTPTAGTTVHWAVESDQVNSATGKRRTIPAGGTGGATGLYVPNGATLYLGASGTCVVEIEIYNKY